MEQTVRVREVYENGTAQVICIRESACSGDCHKCSGCGAARESILLTAVNAVGADVGDLVTVKSDTARVLKAAAVLYMLPLVLFFAGYGLAAALELSGALFGGIAFVLSVMVIICYDRRVAKRDNTTYTITGYAGEFRLKSGRKGDHDLG